MTDNAKHFDNCGVVFVSGWYKTEGDSPCKDYNEANGVHGYCQHDVCIVSVSSGYTYWRHVHMCYSSQLAMLQVHPFVY